MRKERQPGSQTQRVDVSSVFVACACDLGSEDSRVKVHDLLIQYGMKKIQDQLYESATLSEKNVARMKVDLDKMTDFYDKIRLYQYPIEDTLVITSLEGKKWRRLTAKV